MIALFFEVQTRPGHRDQYLDLAASLKPDLTAMGGCLFIDRFSSLTRENLLLSYQIWQDEAAMTAWRVHGYHHEVQTIGREKVFSDYRIRIAQARQFNLLWTRLFQHQVHVAIFLPPDSWRPAPAAIGLFIPASRRAVPPV